MGELFLKIVNMSIAASWLILAVLVLRLILKKAPKWVNVLLWSLVAFRLLCPVSIESILSLIPSAETIPGKVLTGSSFRIHSGIDIVDTHVNGYLGDGYYEGVTVAVDNGLHIVTVLALIWAMGILLFLAYTAFSYWRLHRQVETAVLLRDNIFRSEFLDSPFVLGLIKPKIYLPLSLPEPDVAHVIAHEQAHLRRRDHWWKPLGFLLLTLHWFNPFMWLGYILLCRDIELACDEKVIRELGTQQRADYSQALLRCSVSRRWIAACPLAFGEVGVKQRIKRVLHYKKPAFWIIAAAILACILIALCFLTDPLVFGVRDIHLTAKGSSGANLTIRYLGIHSYSVEQLDADDGEYIGDGLIGYDGSLGKYRILIKLGDANTMNTFQEKYPTGEVHVLEGLPDAMGSTLKMKLACPDDSSLFLYLGSDYPIWAEETDIIKLPELPFPQNITVKISLQDPTAAADNTVSFQSFDFSAIDGILLTNLHNGNQTTITDSAKISKICAFLKTVSGIGGSSGKGYYEGSYEVTLMEGSQVLESIGFGDHDVFYHGDFGDGYSTRYLLEDMTVSDVISFFSPYEEIPFDWKHDAAAETEPDAKQKLTLADVVTLSKKGYDLTWDDFKNYEYSDIGSGVHDYKFDIRDSNMYWLHIIVSGENFDSAAILLESSVTETFTDIRQAGIFDELISDTVAMHHRLVSSDGLIHIRNHIVLSKEPAVTTDSTENPHIETVYLLIMQKTYRLENGVPVTVSTECVPTAITFANYNVTEYWEPRDGEYYETDIRAKFPKAVAEEVLNSQVYTNWLEEVCDQQVLIHAIPN